MNMKITEFMEEVRKRIGGSLEKECTVEIQEVEKNNGVKLHGLIIHSSRHNISPTIYLDSFFEAYRKGVRFEEVVSKIIRIYKEDTPKQNVSLEFFKSFDKIKDRICYRLIGMEKNQELLKKIPFVPFLDMAICFYYAYEGSELGTGTILIYHSHIQMWNTDTEELLRLAGENTPKLFPWDYKNIEELLSGVQTQSECVMKILTNRQKTHGAACILYPQLLEKLCGQSGVNFFLLPSSIHEMILIADRGGIHPQNLKEIVCEVNATQVEPEEVLSDKIYYYDISENQVKIII